MRKCAIGAGVWRGEETLRGTLKASPSVLPIGWLTRYFFFAVFFADFFAGAFLAAFLVAICLFSLFDGLHRYCRTKCS